MSDLETRRELALYRLGNPDMANADVLDEAIGSEADLFLRWPSKAHVTGSAWILNEACSHTLLIGHAKYGIFVPPGGHTDPGENPQQAAWREASEETGIEKQHLRPIGNLLDVDVHEIPANEKRGEGRHWHCDARYPFIASAEAKVNLNLEECTDVKWVPLSELLESADQSLRRLAQKSLELYPSK